MAKSEKNTASISICGLILCAGSGSRTGLAYNKLLHYVGKKTILEMTIDRFNASRVTSILLVVAPNDLDTIKNLTQGMPNVTICLGGATRTESVRKGLSVIGHCDIVCIHDGARPYINPKIIDKSIDSAIEFGSGVVAVPTVDSIKEVINNDIIRSLARAGLYNIQTPQTFVFSQICSAYSKIQGDFTDDSEVFEKAGFTCKIVVGDYENVKVTSMQDVFRATPLRSKIGVGFDVHKLVRGRPLILGGMNIPNHKGLLGHSDADVLVHAIMDSLLSAAGLPDIGVLFPDTDNKFKNISSINLLAEVHGLISRRGFTVGNVSAVIMAQKPKLYPYIPQMQQIIANVLKVPPQSVNVSATTTEHLGIIGHEKGMAASATCMLLH